jgi:hypothetical protein
MKKALTVVLIMIFAFSFLSIRVSNALAVNNLQVTLSSHVAGANTEVKFTMQMSANLNRDQNMYIQFPVNYQIPDVINVNDVLITWGSGSSDSGSGHPASISVNKGSDDTVITLRLNDPLVQNEPVIVDFYSTAGIKNPVTPGTYSFEVWTDTYSMHTSVSTPVTPAGGNGNSVSGLTVVSVNPVDAGKVADYLIMFNVSDNGALVGPDDYVDVYFPQGTKLPTHPDPSNVLVKTFPCTNVTVNNNIVRVYLPNNVFVAPGAQCNIEFLKAFGIVNPEIPGNYALMVTTSKDTGLASSNIFTIIGTSITGLSVTVSPTAQLATAEYKISFRTGTSDGALTKSIDKINILFPGDVTLPSNVVPGAITVDNVPCTSVTINDQKLTIITPVNISANSNVVVDITKNFGIKNPAHTGQYKIKVYTSANSSPVETSFTITSSLVSNVNVALSNTSSGAVSAYTISFQTGTSGALTGGVDKINVVFPVGTTMPDTIPNSAVTVNGIPTTDVVVSGTTVTVTVPTSIPANSTVSVVFSEKANIKNPVLGGSYKLSVSTTKENTPVESVPYTISVVPQAKITIMPSKPDGLNGYYKTQPAISFTATSSVDPNPYIYYYFDGNEPVLYNGTAVKVPEGTHILYYYAMDHRGHKQETQSVIFKVDTIPPQLVIASPKNNAVLNSKTFEVKGTVDIGSTVKVDGKPVAVSSSGSFTAQVTMNGDSAVITVVAEDLAGNTTTKTIAVSLDTTPPALTVTSPVPFQEIHKLPVVVQGKTEKDATVTVNGNTVTVNEDGTFSYALSSLPEGAMSVITVIAKDPAGNETKKMINVKYIKTTIMKLQIGNKIALVNTSTETLDAPPVIIKNRTFVPLRFISEAFGAKLTWDPIFQLIDISLGSDSLRLQIGKDFAEVNGKKVLLDAAPVIVKGRTMVPIRFISEALDAQVLWDDATKTVTIIYPKSSQP